MILTPKHVDRIWKAYPVENKEESLEFECGAASTSGYLKKKCVDVNMDKSGNCMPRGSKDYEVKLAVVWKRSSMQR